MNKRELEEELKKTSADRKFLEEAEPYEKFKSVKDHICKLAGDYKCWDNRLTHDEALELCKVLEQESCEDAISREDVIKAIDRHTFDTDDGLCLDEDISIILEELPPVKPTQKWIPVSERLPEKDVEVLATTEWGEVTIAIYCVTDWLIHEGDTNAETDEIVAWMPLPEPYTEKLD